MSFGGGTVYWECSNHMSKQNASPEDMTTYLLWQHKWLIWRQTTQKGRESEKKINIKLTHKREHKAQRAQVSYSVVSTAANIWTGNKIQFLCVFSFEIKPQFIATIIMALKSKFFFSLYVHGSSILLSAFVYRECVPILYAKMSTWIANCHGRWKFKAFTFWKRILLICINANKFHSISNQIRERVSRDAVRYVEY